MRIFQGRRLLAVGALAAAMLLSSQAAAFASDFIVYPGPGYSGQALDLRACGYNRIPAGYNGSYIFQYTGQTAAAYNTPDASGVASFQFTGDASQDTPYGWQSVWIQCS
jgi:hypothetical protein